MPFCRCLESRQVERHWLDVARFAESNGATKNTIWPDAWRYRDFVIDSFNADKPYHEFLKEQIAGDLLPSESDEERWERIVAAGFLALGSKANNATRMEVIGEQLDVMGRAMLGLSIGCARCHDHKYDPIPTRDFYALAGIMQNTAILDGKPFASLEPRLEKGQLQKVKTIERAIAAASRGVVQANERLEELAAQQNVRRRPGELWEVVLSRFTDKGRLDKARATLQQLTQAEADLEKLRQVGPPDVLLGVSVTDRAAKGSSWLNARVHIRGSDTNLGDEVPRGLMQVLLVWGGEFGRTPAIEDMKDKSFGRDHNGAGFTYWMAGGGVKGGIRHGATDELGWFAAEDKVHARDLHATILHLLGLNHQKLTFRYGGRDYTPTDVDGEVVKEIIA